MTISFNKFTPIKLRLSLTALFFVTILTQLNAQKFVNDTSYFEVFPRTITARLYGIHKYNQFVIPSNNNTPNLKYTPNTKYSLGAGVTYNNFTLNGALGFGFLNKDSDKGKTSSFNLQVNAFPQTWTVSLLLTFYNGEHLRPIGSGFLNQNKYYYRPDVKSDFVGVGAYKIANATKFSYRAAIIQNEWQKKSAGSLLYGGQAFYGLIHGDSSLVPSVTASSFKQAGIDKISNISIGPGIGYAYTLVAFQHLYVMGSFIASATVNFSKEYTAGNANSKVSFEPAGIYKAAVGYNSSSWGVAGIWAGTAVLFKGASSTESYFVPTGLFSVAISKKIFLNKSLNLPILH